MVKAFRSMQPEWEIGILSDRRGRDSPRRYPGGEIGRGVAFLVQRGPVQRKNLRFAES